jgi:hypothetical protein
MTVAFMAGPPLIGSSSALTAYVAASVPDWIWAPWRFLGGVLFENWEGSAVQRATWEELMYGAWIALALTAAAVLVLDLVTRRAGYPASRRVLAWTAGGFSLLGFLAYFSFFNPTVRYVDYYHRHEFFHYYLGSKYSAELGYTRLYECTAVAEVELGFGSRLKGQELRDLGAENLIKPITDTHVFDEPERCTQHFSSERWQTFKDDVQWLESKSRGTYWGNMKKDHGYNPPPVWTMTGKLWSALGPASDTTFKLLSSVDVLLHAATLLTLRWAFGWRVAAVAAVFWGTNAAGNFYWTGGAFLRQDWVFLFIGSMCLAKKKHFGLAGAAFTWSGLLRLFPFAAGFGWLAMIALYWLRHRRFHPDHMRFLAGCVACALVLVPASVIVAGPGSYREFASHIALHNKTPLTNHMGLQVIFEHSWEGRMRFAKDDSQDDPFEGWKRGRLERMAALRPLSIAVWLGLGLWTVWVLSRCRHFWVGLPMSLPLVGSLTNITCYYFVMFVAFASLVRLRPSLGPALLVAAAGSQVMFAHSVYIDDRFTAISYIFFTLSLLPLIAFSRPPTKQRLRAWLEQLKGPAKRDPRADLERAAG